jgi:DNA-binding NarL/FixJ family response regulator
MWLNDKMMINKCCLLINEDPSEQAMFVKAIADVSPQTLCFVAPDGIDGLYMMLREGILPDHIFVEMVMPRMNALNFLKAVKKVELLRDIPVVVHVVRPMPNQIIEIKEAGAAALYLREYDFDGICSMLHIYMGDVIPSIHPN